ncbi:hypothetical protein ACQEVZ_02500 [Dactylosporangium sp. CA-152071]|uniref:hypothetical protein n=1 Tax=Dactylosporangium sp. CA-152071 TaxID=3239933 RepID=UPI003D8E8A07
MHRYFEVTEPPADERRRPRRTDAHVVTVGEKEHYDPRSARDAAEYRIVLGYSKR